MNVMKGRKHRCEVVLAVVTAVLAVASTGTAQSAPTSEADLGLAKKAMTHELLVSGDPSLVALQFDAFELFWMGLTPDEIIDRTGQRWRNWRRLKATGADDSFAPAEALAVARSIARHASRLSGRTGTAASGTSNPGIEYVDAKLRGGPVTRSAQRWVAEHRDPGSGASPADEIFETLAATYGNAPEFRSVWDEMFKVAYGFTPVSTDADVLATYSGFKGNRELEALVGYESTTELVGALSRATDTLTEVTQDTLGTLAELRSSARKNTASRKAEEARRREETRQRIDVANALTIADVATTMLGLADPTIGRPIAATTTAILNVHHAIERFRAADLAGASVGLAGVAFLGDIAGAVTRLFSTLFGGPSTDEIILQELGKIRRQIAALGEAMHERFDQVHEHLEVVHEALVAGINALRTDHQVIVGNQEVLLGNQLNLARQQGLALRQLEQLVGGQSDLVRLLDQFGKAVTARDRSALAPCHRRYRPSEGDEMTLTTFLDCVSRHAALTSNLPAAQLQVTDPRLQAQLLTEQPDRALNLALQIFRDAARPLGDRVDLESLPRTVVSTAHWIDLANLVDDLLARHPEYQVANELDEYVPAMRSFRAALLLLHAGLKADIEAYRAGQASVIGHLIHQALEDTRSIETSVVDDSLAGYYQSPRFRLGSVNADGEPEIRIEDGPYAWRPLREFEAGVPSWLDLSSRPCSSSMEVSDIRTPLHRTSSGVMQDIEWIFKQGGMARFVNGEDLALARAGFGTVAVCLYYHDSSPGRRAGNDRTGVRFLFVGSPDSQVCRPGHEVKSQRLVSPDARHLTNDLLKPLLTAYGSVPARRQIHAACHEEYAEFFSAHQQSLSDHVRHRLSTSATVESLDRRLALANAVIRRLLQFVLADVADHSPLVRHLLAGQIGLPDLGALIDDGPAAWTIAEVARDQVEAFAAAIRSPEIGDALMDAPGIEAITGTAYQFLDAVP